MDVYAFMHAFEVALYAKERGQLMCVPGAGPGGCLQPLAGVILFCLRCKNKQTRTNKSTTNERTSKLCGPLLHAPLALRVVRATWVARPISCFDAATGSMIEDHFFFDYAQWLGGLCGTFTMAWWAVLT